MRLTRLIPILLLLLAAAATGCHDGDNVEIQLNGGSTKARIVANTGPITPTGPLTVTEKKKLLKAIRKDPKRIRTLTNRERRWLAGAALQDD